MRSIAIVNQKGGCGKTTTTVNLAGALVAEGQRVLVVDMDPQAHSCLALGVEPDELDENLYEVLSDPVAGSNLEDVCVPIRDGLALAPSSVILSALEQKLASERQQARTERLAIALESVAADYDYALIDCPPNVGLLTFNALRAAREVIVPVETSFFAIDGVQKLLETIGLLSERLQHQLDVRILPTLYDGRTRYARQTLSDIRELFSELCFDTVIRQTVKLREAARRGVPVVFYAASSNAAADYQALALEVDASGAPAVVPLIPEEIAPETREVELHFRNTDAGDVRIAGDFNGWVPDKGVRSIIESKGATRVWTKVLKLAPGTYEYRYIVDGEWRADPDNPTKVVGSTGSAHSILVVR
ncbi:MAG: AAA family ATPase [Myxococcota bacterium]